MFFRLVAIFAVIAAVVAEMDPKLIAQLRSKHQSLKQAKPSNHGKISAAQIKAQNIETEYLTIHNYNDNSHCKGYPNLVMGLSFNACVAGDVDPTTGAPLTSVKYFSNEAGETFMSYYSESGTCTGASTDNMVSVPTPCINNNMKITKEVSSEPWSSVNSDGVVMKFFDTAESCLAGGGGYDFMWYSSSFCIPDVAEDLSYMSYKYTGCDDTGVTVVYYVDRYCSSILRSETVPPSDCLSTTSNMQPAWISQACTEHITLSPTLEPTAEPTLEPTLEPTA